MKKAGRQRSGKSCVAANAPPASMPATMPASEIEFGETPHSANRFAAHLETFFSLEAIGRRSD